LALMVGVAPGGWVQYVCGRLSPDHVIVSVFDDPECYVHATVNNSISYEGESGRIASTDGGGDLTSAADLASIVEACSESCTFFSSDACLESTWDQYDKERPHFKILVGAVYLALTCLVKNGNCVIKFFDGACLGTQTVLYSLGSQFRQMFIVKPITSRPASGELFAVCKGFGSGESAKLLSAHLLGCLNGAAVGEQSPVDFCFLPQIGMGDKGWNSLTSALDVFARKRELALSNVNSYYATPIDLYDRQKFEAGLFDCNPVGYFRAAHQVMT